MNLRLVLPLALMVASADTFAQNIFDALNKAASVVRQVQQAQTASPATGGAQPNTQPAGVASYGEALFGLRPFPNATTRTEYANPYDRVTVPLSVPTSSGGNYVARYSAPIEGKVWGAQYHHSHTESPLRIDEHYEALLVQQGFEKLMTCDDACHRKANVHAPYAWSAALETHKQFAQLHMPTNSTVKVFYRGDGLVVTGVGTWGNSGDGYTSFVYAVQGKILDMQPIESVKAMNANQAPATLPAEYRGPASNNATMGRGSVQKPLTAPVAFTGKAEFTPCPPFSALDSRMPLIKGDPDCEVRAIANCTVNLHSPSSLCYMLDTKLKSYVVLLSSLDPNCRHCIEANDRFNEFAIKNKKHAFNTIMYMRTTWEPYTDAFKNPVLTQYGIAALPAYLIFKNGVLVGRLMGNSPVADIERELKKIL